MSKVKRRVEETEKHAEMENIVPSELSCPRTPTIEEAGPVAAAFQTLPAGKQLSTIMETTEPTSSTGTTTKSTIISSPESDTEMQKLETVGKPNFSVAAPTSTSMAFGFQIFEDKTENIVAPTPIKVSPLVLGNASKIDKENCSIAAQMAEILPIHTLQLGADDEPEELSVCQQPAAAVNSPKLSSMMSMNFGALSMAEPPQIIKNSCAAAELSMSLKCQKSFKATEDVVRPKPAFEVFVDEEPPAAGGLRISDRAEFYDFFAQTPEKPGKVTYDPPDSTQALLKLNVHDSKNISLLAKECEKFAVPEVKMEASLHITDNFAMPAPPKSTPATLFVEDNDVDTVQFNQFLENVQNSTLIGTFEPAPPPHLKAAASTEQREASKLDLSLSLKEAELQELAAAEAVEAQKKLEPPTKPLRRSTRLRKSRYSVVPIPIPMPLDQKSSHEDDLGRSIYESHQEEDSKEFTPEDWDDLLHDRKSSAQFLRNEIGFNETNAIINEHLNEEIVNPFDRVLIAAFLEKFNFIGYLEQSMNTCSFKNKIPQLSKGVLINCGGKEFEIVKVLGKGTYGTVFR